MLPHSTQNGLLILAIVKRMNTETTSAPAAPGNLSVRQLAATLTTTAPAPGDQAKPGTKSEPAATAAPAPKKEPESPEPPAATEVTESLTTDDSSRAAETAPGEETETSPAAETTEAAPEAPTEAETPLPKELQEAIEIAKAQDGGKGKAEMLKRIHKLTDARDTERNARLTAEEQNAQLRRELQQAKSQPSPTATPAGVHPEVHKVQQELANVDHWMSHLETMLPQLDSGEMETAELTVGDQKIQVNAKQVRQTLKDLANTRQEVVAKKVQTEQKVTEAFQQAYQHHHAAALTKFPQLKDPNSDWSVKAKQILTAVPGIRAFPDHEILIGHFLRGMELDAATAKKPATVTRKAAPEREPTKVSTTPPGGGAEPEEATEKDAKQSNQKFQQSGSMKDLARSLTASRRASRNTKR